MRILYLAHSATAHITRPMEFLLHQGHEVVLVGAEDPWPNGREGYGFVRHQGNFRNYAKLLNKVGELFHPHIVHVHYAWLPVYYAVKAALAPVIVSVMGSDVNDFVELSKNGCAWRHTWLRRWDLRLALPKCAKIIVDDATMFAKCHFITPECASIELMHLGVNTKQFRPPSKQERDAARTRFGYKNEDIVFFSPRVLTKFYNHHIILEQFSAIASTNKNAKLLFKKYTPSNAPEDIAYAEDLIHRAKSLPCANRIQFVPALPMDELHTLYWASDAIINYPQEDGFPVTLAEAGACCTPIITVDLPAYKDTFIDKYSFYKFSPLKKEDIQLGLERYITEKNNSITLLQKAQSEVLRYYNFELYCSRMLFFYESIIAERNSQYNKTCFVEKDFLESVRNEFLKTNVTNSYHKKVKKHVLCKLVPKNIKILLHLIVAFVNIREILKLFYFEIKKYCYKNFLIQKFFWKKHAVYLYNNYKDNTHDYDTLKECLAIYKPKTLLEIGCGNGRLFRAYVDSGVNIIVGQDISSTAIDFAQQRNIPNSTLHLCSIDKLEYGQNYFDLVVCSRVLQHIPPEQIEGVLQKICYLSRTVYINELTEAECLTNHGTRQIISHYTFQHDYNSLFMKNGFVPIKTMHVEQGVCHGQWRYVFGKKDVANEKIV